MTLDNFVVRLKRRWVDTYSAAGIWKDIGEAQLRELADHVSGLPSTLAEEDEEAKRFDLLLLRLQLCILNAEPGFARSRLCPSAVRAPMSHQVARMGYSSRSKSMS